MANIAGLLKEEIRKQSKRVLKSETAQLKKLSAQHRRGIAELKRQVASLTRQVSFLERQEKRRIVRTPSAKLAEGARFSPKWVKSHRDKLGISAADYGKLVGVTGLTIYNWEAGKSKPRQKQLAQWVAVRGLGKREAMKRLEIVEG
ncbi:MAG: helix-turn-helix domain-containing protein [Planctomycetes bacterium]|nr:helix-turn-helix domain-containing protein [Planctomycetota bacterium]